MRLATSALLLRIREDEAARSPGIAWIGTNLMSELSAPYSRPNPTQDQECLRKMKDRIAGIYQTRSKSLASLFHFREAGGRTEIVTPFLDPTNRKISVFIEPSGEDFSIADGGLALRIVKMSGRTDGESILRELIRDYGLSLVGDSLRVLSSEADLLAKQFRLCNALVSLRDRLSHDALS